MAQTDVTQLWREASKHPAVLVAGVAGAGLLAVLAVRNSGQGEGGGPPDAAAAPEADMMGTDPYAAGDLTGAAYGGGSPYAGPPGAGYDPYQFTDPYAPPADGGTPPDWYGTPPDWYTNPPGGGTPPPGPGTTPGGCPLPKPTLAPSLVGKYTLKCRNGAWRLVAVAGTNPPPGTTPPPAPAPNVAAGSHVTFAGHRNGRGVLVLDRRQVINLARPAHWTLGPKVTGDTTPGKHGGAVAVRKIQAAPGHGGQVGRFLKVG